MTWRPPAHHVILRGRCQARTAPPAPRPRPPVWLFDLDNTLHDARPHVFPHINRSMNAYLREHLGMEHAQADHLRKHYWIRYGATLLGLMRHHGVDPRHFLWHTHQFPELDRMLVADRGLKAMLQRLPGRKILFSNSPIHYAVQVVGALGIAAAFDRVFAIEHTGYRPKPATAGFRRLLQLLRVAPRRCIMVEDTPANLRPAKRLGMRTVLVSAQPQRAAYVDARVSSVLRLPKLWRAPVEHVRGS